MFGVLLETSCQGHSYPRLPKPGYIMNNKYYGSSVRATLEGWQTLLTVGPVSPTMLSPTDHKAWRTPYVLYQYLGALTTANEGRRCSRLSGYRQLFRLKKMGEGSLDLGTRMLYDGFSLLQFSSSFPQSPRRPTVRATLFPITSALHLNTIAVS